MTRPAWRAFLSYKRNSLGTWGIPYISFLQSPKGTKEAKGINNLAYKPTISCQTRRSFWDRRTSGKEQDWWMARCDSNSSTNKRKGNRRKRKQASTFQYLKSVDQIRLGPTGHWNTRETIPKRATCSTEGARRWFDVGEESAISEPLLRHKQGLPCTISASRGKTRCNLKRLKSSALSWGLLF